MFCPMRRGNMLKVLIADDEEKIGQLIIKLINWEEMGLKIAATASNGIEALEQAKICKPEILITDIRMPGIDGMELIRNSRHCAKATGWELTSVSVSQLSSISSPAGYFSRSLTVSLILANNCLPVFSVFCRFSPCPIL